MSTSDRIPSDDEVRGRYSDGAIWQGAETETSDQHLEDFDAWLDRVKRDAAREALDGLADEANHVDRQMDGPSFALRVRRFKNRKYPEETP